MENDVNYIGRIGQQSKLLKRVNRSFNVDRCESARESFLFFHINRHFPTSHASHSFMLCKQVFSISKISNDVGQNRFMYSKKQPVLLKKEKVSVQTEKKNRYNDYNNSLKCFFNLQDAIEPALVNCFSYFWRVGN